MFALRVGFVNVRARGAAGLSCSSGRSLSCTGVLPAGGREKALRGAACLRGSAGRRSPPSHIPGVVPEPPDQHRQRGARARGCSRRSGTPHGARDVKRGPSKEPACSRHRALPTPPAGLLGVFPVKYLHSVFPEELAVPVSDPARCPRHPAEVGHHHTLRTKPKTVRPPKLHPGTLWSRFGRGCGHVLLEKSFSSVYVINSSLPPRTPAIASISVAPHSSSAVKYL